VFLRVKAISETVEIDGDYTSVEGIRLTCERCGHEVEVYGTEERSLSRAAVMLKEECPKGERNYYVVEED
jgi:hypothetical protein